MSIFSKIFGTKNEREIKTLNPLVQLINNKEAEVKKLSDQMLLEKIQTFKANITQDVKNLALDAKKDEVNKILDPVLPDVFALVREASVRVLGMRHYDVQLIGGIALHRGKIAEMKTGEGKTLMSTLAVILNALCSKGVHVVTTNDYLASRDAEWMGKIYRFLGLNVGVVLPNMSNAVKKETYLADITYGQNNEFGFDYLRDNMKFSLKDYVQREHFFAIVDEVDSILIDEARTPLIISGPSSDSSEKYQETNNVVPGLRKDLDFTVDEKSKSVMLTEGGIEKVEKSLNINNLYDPANIEYLHHVNQCLRAHALFKRDVDYVVERGEVLIVDEHTGRIMHGRRWSDGLHQAVEAKENVRIQSENQTLATITFQNYFRMYQKLSGMTGTADTEAEEFAKIYDLDVLVIPTNKPLARSDEQDLIFKTESEKFEAVAKDIHRAHEKNQPVLVGTVSVEKSELISRWLNKLNIHYNVLNAKKHRDEASVIAQAGRAGAVTIATNMAGRGTDIILGGDPEFMARSNVAQKMQETNEQTAQYAFLNGKPEMLDALALAKKDAENPNYYVDLNEQIKSILKEGKDPKKEGLPETIEEAKERIFEERKSFYDRAIKAYAEELPKCVDICQKEKAVVLKAGGLRVIGTERHESRRIDNQLRGRSGRQGDPGSSIFYLSLQDDLMRIFGSDRMIGMMERLGMDDGVPIEHPWVTKSIANAQKRVEGFHFDSRKQVIEYDDVMNQQRKTVYKLRREILSKDKTKELIFDLVEQAIVNTVQMNTDAKTQSKDWNTKAITDEMKLIFGIDVEISEFKGTNADLMDMLFLKVQEFYEEKEEKIGKEFARQIEHFVYLQTIDQFWKDHLQAMDHLREGIHFRGYAQKDPKQEYKKEGLFLFQNMMAFIRADVLEKVFKVEIRQEKQQTQEEIRRLEQKQKEQAKKRESTQILSKAAVDSAARKDRMVNLPSKAEKESEQKLNRHQRRALKKISKKDKVL